MVALALLALALVPSSRARDHACTLVGAEPGVRVSGGVSGATVRVCAGADCGTTTFVGGVGFVGLHSLRPGRSVELTAIYNGRKSRATVVPDKFEPNGAECGPSVAAARLTFDREGRARG